MPRAKAQRRGDNQKPEKGAHWRAQNLKNRTLNGLGFPAQPDKNVILSAPQRRCAKILILGLRALSERLQ